MTDEALREACASAKSGDRDAFATIYQATVDELFRYVIPRVGSRDDAFDVVHNVFLELWNSLPSFTFESRGGFYRYLYTITKRQVIRHYRAQKRTDSLDDIPEIPDDNPSPEALERTVLAKTLSLMREPERSILELRYWGGFTFAEIAIRIGMSESATKVRHFRALRSLQKAFNNHEARD